MVFKNRADPPSVPRNVRYRRPNADSSALPFAHFGASPGWGLCLGYLGVLLLLLLVAPATHADEHNRILKGGWYLWDPYQYLDDKNGVGLLTGLDIELTRAIAKEAGYQVQQPAVSWQQHIEDLRTGARDIASGATFTGAREQFATFSKPYRDETNVLYLPVGDSSTYLFDNVDDMLRTFKAQGFRLGVVAGYAYVHPWINAFIADPENATQVVPVANDYENFVNLMEGQIDGFITDKLVGATTAWRGGWRGQAEPHPLEISVPIHFMFSKASVSDETVAAFNAAIDQVVEDGAYDRIFAHYLFPVMVAQILDTRWFLILDVIGTIAFAISGVLIASRKGYSFVGAFVLSALPAVGGGTLRDLLVDRHPIAVASTPLYLVLVLATVLIGFLIIGGMARLRRSVASERLEGAVEVVTWQGIHLKALAIFDAIGLATFTVIGVAVAVGTQASPLWLWGPILAMVTGAGGGIVRDIVCQRGDIPFLRTEVYAEVALFWGFLFSIYLLWRIPEIHPEELLLAVVVVVVGGFATRMAAVHFGLRNPLFPRIESATPSSETKSRS